MRSILGYASAALPFVNVAFAGAGAALRYVNAAFPSVGAAAAYPKAALMYVSAGFGYMKSAAARVKAKKKSGAAFQFGLYGGGMETHTFASFETAGDEEYHAYPIFVDSLEPGAYFWIGPAGNGEAVQTVYVDRIFIRKEAAKKGK